MTAFQVLCSSSDALAQLLNTPPENKREQLFTIVIAISSNIAACCTDVSPPETQAPGPHTAPRRPAWSWYRRQCVRSGFELTPACHSTWQKSLPPTARSHTRGVVGTATSIGEPLYEGEGHWSHRLDTSASLSKISPWSTCGRA